MTDEATRTWLRYTHLEKLYGYLPGMPDAIPGIFGLSAEEYAEVRATFDREARAAAGEMLDEVGSLVDALPFEPGQTVLAVGDSITDDLCSWVEVLRHLLALRRGDDGIEVVNGGLSAHTSAMVLRRWPATLATRPDWVVCALGANDVTRVGPDAAKPQVSLSESVANLSELRRIAGALTECSWIWMTPAPVLEERVRENRGFRYGHSTWRNDDIVALAGAMHDFEEPVVDLTDAFGVPPQPDLQGDDGVHVSVAGQQAIATTLVRTLADTAS